MNYKIRHNATLSSATAIMIAIFWTELDFCIISDCRNSFNNKLFFEERKDFFNSANTHFLSEESLKEKSHAFMFPFHLVQ